MQSNAITKIRFLPRDLLWRSGVGAPVAHNQMLAWGGEAMSRVPTVVVRRIACADGQDSINVRGSIRSQRCGETVQIASDWKQVTPATCGSSETQQFISRKEYGLILVRNPWNIGQGERI